MKNLLRGLLFLFTTLCYSQELQKGYYFNTIYMDSIFNIQFKENYRVKVIDTIYNKKTKKYDIVKFRVFNFKKNSLLNTKFVEENGKIKSYTIDREKFNKYTSRIYPAYKGVRAGFYTIPFKLRIDDFDFEQNINFGMNVGLQFRMSKKLEDKWIYEPNIGIGLSSINLNSKNSNVTETRTASAFTVSGGIILHLNKTINLGVFYGFDFLGNEDIGTNWKYNKKPWLGIGINVGFSISKSEDSKVKNYKK